MSAARRDFETMERPSSPFRMSAARRDLEGPVAAAVPVQPERVERDYMNQLRQVEAEAMSRNAAKRQQARNARALSQLQGMNEQFAERRALQAAAAAALGVPNVRENSPVVAVPINPVVAVQEAEEGAAATIVAEINPIEALNAEFGENAMLPEPAGNPVMNARLSGIMLARLRLNSEPEFTSAEFQRLSVEERQDMSKALAERWGVPKPNRFSKTGYPVQSSRHEPWWLKYNSGIFRG
jgi:hypothetical protein